MTKPVLTQEQLRELMSHMVERVDGSTEQGLQAAYTLGWKARGERDANVCEAAASEYAKHSMGRDRCLRCAAAIRKEVQ